MLIVLIGISFLTFLLTFISPGDPVRDMYISMGLIPDEQLIAETREQMGLNDPWGKPVVSLLASRLWPTLKLALISMVLMLIVAVPLGVLSAVNQNKPIDYIVRAITFFGVSVPNFWVGLLLILVFCVKLKLLPVVSSGGSFKDLILPAVTLAVAMSAKYTRQVRTAVLEELHSDYVVGARARGVPERKILWGNVFPNSLLPLITMLGLSIGSLLGGTSVVEVIFSYPGMGKMAVDAITTLDYNMIQAFVLWVALIYMVINLLVDMSYNYIDPRMRLRR